MHSLPSTLSALVESSSSILASTLFSSSKLFSSELTNQTRSQSLLSHSIPCSLFPEVASTTSPPAAYSIRPTQTSHTLHQAQKDAEPRWSACCSFVIVLRMFISLSSVVQPCAKLLD
ncbi:hypothetical protein NXS19_002040 [Fusarium pseudograminearum]|nr:hypothetical protein NXS19_002040 [Fusarium pseudograminearum]